MYIINAQREMQIRPDYSFMILKHFVYLHYEKKDNSIRSLLQRVSCHSNRKRNSEIHTQGFLNRSLYELRIEYNSNIYRIFFIFDEGKIVVLFNGFQKKTQKTPKSEIEKALKIKEEYYEYKRQHDNRH